MIEFFQRQFDAFLTAQMTVIQERWIEFMSGVYFSFYDFVSCIIYIYMMWACLCIMMNREYTSVPPFGKSKPMDTIFFSSSFYFIIAILKAQFK